MFGFILKICQYTFRLLLYNFVTLQNQCFEKRNPGLLEIFLHSINDDQYHSIYICFFTGSKTVSFKIMFE